MKPKEQPYYSEWRAASGHKGGWRVVKGICPMEELRGPKGKLLLFKTYESAQKRADSLNSQSN